MATSRTSFDSEPQAARLPCILETTTAPTASSASPLTISLGHAPSYSMKGGPTHHFIISSSTMMALQLHPISHQLLQPHATQCLSHHIVPCHLLSLRPSLSCDQWSTSSTWPSALREDPRGLPQGTMPMLPCRTSCRLRGALCSYSCSPPNLTASMQL